MKKKGQTHIYHQKRKRTEDFLLKDTEHLLVISLTNIKIWLFKHPRAENLVLWTTSESEQETGKMRTGPCRSTERAEAAER